MSTYTPMVRSFLDALIIPDAPAPHNVVQLQVFYPAVYHAAQTEIDTGILPVDEHFARLPLVIFLQGVNIPADGYRWLMHELAAQGNAVVLVSWLAQNLAGRTSFTPGIRLAALQPVVFGTQPSSTVLGPLRAHAAAWCERGVLAGRLDLARVMLGGHSAGGSMALLHARADWCPGVCGAFAYGANLLATLALGGWPKSELCPLPGEVPLLLIGATEDGISAHHNMQYGDPAESGSDIMLRTWRECMQGGRGDQHVLVLRGANHHTICQPRDDTLGRTFLDLPESADGATLRTTLAAAVCEFTRDCVTGTRTHLAAVRKSALSGVIEQFERK